MIAPRANGHGYHIPPPSRYTVVYRGCHIYKLFASGRVRLLWGGCSRFQDPGHSLCRHGGSACVFDLLIFSMDVGGHGNILGSSWI